MNKDLLDQIPAEEQPVASKIDSLVEEMQPSRAFQWELENQLVEKAAREPARGWFPKIMTSVGWVAAAIGGVILLSWAMRSLVPQPSPAAGPTQTHEVSFEDGVRAGNICLGPLALGHGFSVFLASPEKDEFVVVDAGSTMLEVRSFTWSPDGEQLTIVGNSMGSGAIHMVRPMSGELEYLLSGSGVGYLIDASWSRDGKQLVMWSSQNNRILYRLSVDGKDLVETQLEIHILGTPQFTPDGGSVILFGSEVTSAGLFEVKLSDGQSRLLNPQVEDETGFGFSPDGSHLAYMEMDRETGEARLIAEEIATGDESVLGTLPISQGSGSTIPESANLNWSADGKFIIFDFGGSPGLRSIYLAHTDGSGMAEVVKGYAPSISADGKCLSYISNQQVFLLDLTTAVVDPGNATSILLADLPPGRGAPNFKQDKLGWKP